MTQDAFIKWVNKRIAPHVIGKGWISPVEHVNIVKRVLNEKFPSGRIIYPDVYANGGYKGIDNYISRIWSANSSILKREFSNKNDKYYSDSVNLAAQAGAAMEVTNRYGSAVKEHFVAYSGNDYENGVNLTRGLKKTSQSKVNPEYRKQNIKQQAGFSAEDKYTARKNSEEIINGSKKRYSRTDDLGRVNDPLFDHVMIDENGVEIIGSGEQMKFVGSNPKECLSKLKSQKYRKYIDADAKLVVPSDYYDGILAEADKEIESLSQQLRYAKNSNNRALEASIKERIDNLKKIKKQLKNSGITNAEAIEARLHPKISTAKDIARISHRAGMEQAKLGGSISGGISLITNLVEVCKGNKDPMDAAICVAKDTAGGAVTSYATAFAGSTIKGTMQNSSKSMVRNLSKTNLPAMIVTSTIDVGKSLTRYFKGEISGLECLEQLGEKGTSHLGGAMFATLGQAAIPIPIVGALIGSMIGYTLGSVLYKLGLNTFKEEKLSYQRRIAAEKECREAQQMAQRYRAEMQRLLNNYLNDFKQTFDNAFSLMDEALSSNNVDKFIYGSNIITQKFGGQPSFCNFEEFDNFMQNNNESLIL